MQVLQKFLYLKGQKSSFKEKLSVKTASIQDSLEGLHFDDDKKSYLEEFKCPICTVLVYEPQECSDCESIFCQKCITDWINLGKELCPLCRKKLTLKPIGRKLKILLYEKILHNGCSFLECDLEGSISYKDLIAHYRNHCKEIDVQCPCGEQFQRKDWKNHFKNCPNTKIVCQTCELVFEQNQIESHSCEKQLIKSRNKYKRLMERIQKKFIDLKAKETLWLTEVNKSNVCPVRVSNEHCWVALDKYNLLKKAQKNVVMEDEKGLTVREGQSLHQCKDCQQVKLFSQYEVWCPYEHKMLKRNYGIIRYLLNGNMLLESLNYTCICCQQFIQYKSDMGNVEFQTIDCLFCKLTICYKCSLEKSSLISLCNEKTE